MNALRNLLGVLGGLSAGYAIAALFLLTPTDFGVALAITSACVIGIYLVRAIQADRQREQDKAIHPSMWGRFDGLKPWPTDDEERR